MAVPFTRSIQLSFPLRLPMPRATARRARQRRPLPLPLPAPTTCPDCQGPTAHGEGFLTCVVCGYRRAA